MDKILFNLALIDTTQFSIAQGLDCSGTYLYKTPRKHTYTLLKQDTKRPVCSVTFHKSSTPTHLVYRDY